MKQNNQAGHAFSGLLNRRLGAAYLFAILATSACWASQARAASPDLITRAVDATQRTALAGHVVSIAQAQAESSERVPATTLLSGLSITLNRTPERQQAFDELLREQKDPSSPNYQRWLSPNEIGERFGASQHDIDAVSGWLRSRGLTVTDVSNGRLRIRFSGSATDVATTFATDLRYVETDSRKRMANASDPQIPAAFADAIASVQGLQTVRYRPLLRTRAGLSSPSPAGTSCTSGVCDHVVFPADFSKIYDIDSVSQQGIDGSGQTIAIVGRARLYAPDMQNFQQLTGLPTTVPTVTIPTGGTDPGPPASTCSDSGTPSCAHPSDAVGDQGEATLDVQRASSVAPGAAISLIVSATGSDDNSPDGVQLATEYAIDHDPVPAQILNISFTSCETAPGNTASVATYLDSLFAQAEMEGISVFVASGDGGVAGCASLDATPIGNETVSANVLCASGHVTCVGGTEFADAANPSIYWNSSNGANFLSALGYIPEGVWNDPLDDTDNPQFAASGGGVSVYIAKPSWQVGTGVPGNAGRYTPDVSFAASPRDGYFTCFAAQGGSCVTSGGQFSFLPTGGTSATAPSMAGIAALLNQKSGSAQGNINPRLYALATSGSAAFHDVTVASSGVSNCVLSTPSLCNNSTPGPGGLSGGLNGYAVGTGYDLATGLGSIDVANLLQQWDSGTGSGSTLNLDQFGLSGSWILPNTEGQGVVLTVYPDLLGANRGSLFGGWFTYDVTAAGGQRWYTIQGEVDAGASSATMPIYLSEGGRFDSSQATTLTQVGEATISLTDCSNGIFSYNFTDGSGRSGSSAFTRLLQNVACTPTGTGNATPDYLLSGAWADPSNSSQGLVFEFNTAQNALFAAWYTFTTSATQTSGPSGQHWYTLQSNITPGTSVFNDVDIYDNTGGVFDQPTNVSTVKVGSASLTVHSCTSATLVYQFTGGQNEGVNGTLDLTRIGPAPAGCSL